MGTPPMSEHTPTPWIADREGIYTPDGSVMIAPKPEANFTNGQQAWDANARLIVRAVNSHASLVAASSRLLNEIRLAVKTDPSMDGQTKLRGVDHVAWISRVVPAMDELLAALAAAREEA